MVARVRWQLHNDLFTRDVLCVGEYFVVVGARVDTMMLRQKKPAPENTPPQSNFVNARLNPDWFVHVHDEVANEDHTINGRGAWFSKPVRVKVERS